MKQKNGQTSNLLQLRNDRLLWTLLTPAAYIISGEQGKDKKKHCGGGFGGFGLGVGCFATTLHMA